MVAFDCGMIYFFWYDTETIEDFAVVFIGNRKTLLCNTGKMYDVSKDGIKEKAEVFKYTVV